MPENLDSAIAATIPLFQAGAFREAATRARAALVAHPDSAVLHNVLGAALTRLGDPAAAIESFQRALEHDPAYGGAHNNLGNALRDLGRLRDAHASFGRALRLRPDMLDAHVNIAQTAQLMGRAGESLRHYEKALALAPDSAVLFQDLAVLHAYLGNRAEAAECNRRALALTPLNGALHYNLSTSQRYQPQDPHMAMMEDLLAGRDLPAAERAPVGFALAKALDDLGDTERAFATLKSANEAYRALHPYDIETDATVFAAIRAGFAPRDRDAAPPPGGPIPVFIVGLPRSGTSLMEAILARHDGVFGAGELHALRNALDPRLIAEPSPRIAAARIGAVRAAYLGHLEQIGSGAAFIVDKMPLNFRWIGFILAAMPEAKILHMRRDPVATLWSCYRHYFAEGGLDFSFDLGDLGRYWRLYDELMSFWHARLPGRIMDVSYEDLTEDAARVGRDVAAFCGLDWQDSSLDPAAGGRHLVRSLSAHQVRAGIYRGSSRAWKAYEAHLGPLLAALGNHAAPEGGTDTG